MKHSIIYDRIQEEESLEEKPKVNWKRIVLNVLYGTLLTIVLGIIAFLFVNDVIRKECQFVILNDGTIITPPSKQMDTCEFFKDYAIIVYRYRGKLYCNTTSQNGTILHHDTSRYNCII